jgi:hypothetical protein
MAPAVRETLSRIHGDLGELERSGRFVADVFG